MSDTHLDLILSLMQNDTENIKKQSDLMEFYYASFDEKGKKSIDIIFTSLCGYSLDTIIHHPDDILHGKLKK